MNESSPLLDPGVVLDGRRRVAAEDLIYAELREMLARQKLTPGSHVSEETLAARLGVSRTPLRQALTRLRFDGLVERSANGRLHVTPISVEDAKNVFSVRIVLEQLALEQSFARLTDDVLFSLRGLLAQMSVLGQGSDVSVARYGGEFHATLYRAGGNEINMAFLSMLEGRIDRYRFLSTATGTDRQKRAVREHAMILDALEKRDLRGAKRALREHLERAEQSVLAALRASAAAKPAAES